MPVVDLGTVFVLADSSVSTGMVSDVPLVGSLLANSLMLAPIGTAYHQTGRRSFSVIRRRSNLIDVLTLNARGVDLYRLKWSANFDCSFATFLDSTNVGFRDESLHPYAIETQPTQGSVRIVFNPDTFGVPDAAHIWFELFHVVGGVETQVSPPTLVLPEAAHHGVGVTIIHGDAPEGLDVLDSAQINFPRLSQDLSITNHHATNSLFFATEYNGPEWECKPDPLPTQLTIFGTQDAIWVRGGGANIPFTAIFTLAFPR